ncbi:MAG: hypothetical protein ABEL04_02705 [Salinibacter sp.]|uniref:hypothetical protein n=1 Tax=Salinibacter sp. TaxID=2065818 RepID=UPI0035D41E83
MFALPLNRTTQHRLLTCLFLLAGLLAVSAGVLPASAQQSASGSDEATHRYGWLNGGVGIGRTGLASSVTGGAPVGDRVFVGGRYTQTKELNILSTGPVAAIWDAGPLVGLFEQGRWGHLSVASGATVVGGQRPDDPGTRSITLGVPLDAQVFFTPLRYVGVGVHGYANVNPGDNMLGWSLELQVRLPQ